MASEEGKTEIEERHTRNSKPTKANELADETGRTTFSEKVLTSIVHEAISGMEGLGEVKHKVTDIIHIFGGGQKGIDVDIQNDGISISLNMVGQYGEPLHEISQKIRQRVKSELERLTGLQVKEVNVVVEELQKESTDQHASSGNSAE